MEGPIYISPHLTAGARGNLRVLDPYLATITVTCWCPYRPVPQAAARLAHNFTRPWDLFVWNKGSFLSKYVNLISDILRTQKIRRNWKPVEPNVFTIWFPVLRHVSTGNITNGQMQFFLLQNSVMRSNRRKLVGIGTGTDDTCKKKPTTSPDWNN